MPLAERNETLKNKEKVRVAVLVSGGGTNLQAIIDAVRGGVIRSAEVALVISNNPNAFALTRAENVGIPTAIVSGKEYPDQSEFEAKLIAILEENGIELIVLAGFMRILSEKFTSRYPRRILNVHPSLIPSFCGKGFYGLKVHEAVLAYGVKVTGATVHFVNEIPDGGEIILQKSVCVKKGETAQSLQQRVMRQSEWIILPRAVELVSKEILTNKKGEGKK